MAENDPEYHSWLLFCQQPIPVHGEGQKGRTGNLEVSRDIHQGTTHRASERGQLLCLPEPWESAVLVCCVDTAHNSSFFSLLFKKEKTQKEKKICHLQIFKVLTMKFFFFRIKIFFLRNNKLNIWSMGSHQEEVNMKWTTENLIYSPDNRKEVSIGIIFK